LKIEEFLNYLSDKCDVLGIFIEERKRKKVCVIYYPKSQWLWEGNYENLDNLIEILENILKFKGLKIDKFYISINEKIYQASLSSFIRVLSFNLKN